MNPDNNSFMEIIKLLRKASLFLAIFACLDLALPYAFLVTIIELQLTSQYKLESADVLILGDSHTSAAIDPALFTTDQLSARNYSRGGHYAEFNEALYVRYRHLYGPPKVVVISAPYFIFANGSESSALLSLLDLAGVTKYYFSNQNFAIPNFYQYGTLLQEIPLYTKRLIQGEPNALMQYGYFATFDPSFRTKDLTTSVASAQARVSPIRYQADGYSKTALRNKRNLEFLQRLFQRLSEDQVPVFLVETPEYAGTQEYIQGRAVFYQELQDELRLYPNVTFIPQAEIIAIDPKDQTLFSDGGYGNGNSHLSYKGSQIYTREVSKLVKGTLDALAAKGGKS